MKSIQRLEQALWLWEDISFLLNISYRAHQQVGRPFSWQPFKCLNTWPEYRQALLDSLTKPMSHDDFAQEYVPPLWAYDIYNYYSQVPYILWQWTRNSRRAYEVSTELKWLLENTSVANIKISDLHFPFNSFALVLEEPIKDPSIKAPRGGEYDCITFNFDEGYYPNKIKNPHKSFVWIEMFNRRLRNYHPMSHKSKASLERALAHRDYSPIFNVLRAKSEETVKAPPQGVRINLDSDLTLTEFERSHTAGEHTRLFNGKFIKMEGNNETIIAQLQALRIVIGFCLYLQSLPNQSRAQTPWIDLRKKLKLHPKAIINQAQVCSVGTEGVLSLEERDLLNSMKREFTYELSAHFRCGHWRRAPGSGHDPNAPKIVHVRPTLVRKDRLPVGALPIGLKQNVQ